MEKINVLEEINYKKTGGKNPVFFSTIDFIFHTNYIIVKGKNMVTKILLFILIFSILNVIREIFKFIQAMRDEKPNMTNGRLLGLGLSISYIITIIITGLI